MLAAKQFFKQRFQIEMRPETQVKQEDFDFTARRKEEVVNVEVTALTAEVFSDRTVLNALAQKRKQLPANAPAVIFVVLPEQWKVQRVNWDLALQTITSSFLTGTRRINAIVYWMEEHVDVPDSSSGALYLVRNAFRNSKPRFAIELPFLFQGSLHTDQMRPELQRGIITDRMIENATSSEFFRWVDSLVPLRTN